MIEYLNKPPAALLRRFFMGPIYPIAVALIVFLGYAFEIEFYLNILNMLLAAVMLTVCDSLRPLIVVLCSFLYQIPAAHSPSTPVKSDFLITSPRVYVIAGLFVLVGAALVFFFVRNGLITVKHLKSLPMLSAFAILSAAFLANGAFSGAWTPASLGYGLLNILAFFGIFYIFYLGFLREDAKELTKYLSYVAAVIALVLVAEVVRLYAIGGIIVDGAAEKSKILFGWGNWNSMGQNLAVLIPVIFYGAMKNKCPWFYFAVATATTVAAVLTLSRNASFFSVIFYVACVVIACFYGDNKRRFRIVIPVGAGLLLCCVPFFWNEVLTLLSDFIERGFSSNGREALFEQGVAEFLGAPVFGKGFFGIVTETANFVDFFPQMMHNTPLQLLASMGVVGLAAYVYYRYKTVKLALTRPSLEKTMLAMSVLVLALQSLLDNFIFYVQPMFFYSVALAVCARLTNVPLAEPSE